MMARIHRPPPPVPAAEHEETEDNYGVWSDSEFDDGGELYENYETHEGDEEDNESDYEHPDEELGQPAHAGRPPPKRAVSPAQPPIPPRPGGRNVALPVPPSSSLKPEKPWTGGRSSPRSSAVPLPPERGRNVPQPASPIEDDDMYEAVDTPSSLIHDDDGEVYTEVDEDAVPLKSGKVPEKRSLPPVPVPGGGKPSNFFSLVPKFGGGSKPVAAVPKQPKQPEDKPFKPSLSPQMQKREIPVPPTSKAAPGKGRPVPNPQPSLPPPPPEVLEPEDEDDALYEAGDMYEEKRPSGPRGTKPLPEPPNNSGSGADEGDEYYTEVPETNLNLRKADRPIPPIPPPQPTASKVSQNPLSGSISRFPIAELQAGLARISEAKLNSSASNSSQTAINSISDLAAVKNILKPVNRGESLNTQEKPKTIPVKRTESDNVRAFPKPSTGNKSSLFEGMKNKFETETGRPNSNPTSRSESPSVGNRAEPKAIPSVPEISTRKQSVPKIEVDDLPLPPPPNIPLPRRFPLQNVINEASDSEPAMSDKRKLPVPPAKEVKSYATDTGGRKDFPRPKSPVPEPPLPPAPRKDEMAGLYSFAWYFSTIERSDAEKKILEMKQDGAFMVRKSKRGGDTNPYTLTLLYSGAIYNLHIRRRKDQTFALGSEKPDEHVFSSVEEMISFHRNNPIEVVGKTAIPGKVFLKKSPS